MELKVKPTGMALETINSRSQNNDTKPYLASHNKYQRSTPSPASAPAAGAQHPPSTTQQCRKLLLTFSSPVQYFLGNTERSSYRRQSMPSPEQQCLHGKYRAKQSSQTTPPVLGNHPGVSRSPGSRVNMVRGSHAGLLISYLARLRLGIG